MAEKIEVVRCRDCWYVEYDEESGRWFCHTTYPLTDTVPDGYCHKGERREDGANE